MPGRSAIPQSGVRWDAYLSARAAAENALEVVEATPRVPAGAYRSARAALRTARAQAAHAYRVWQDSAPVVRDG